MEDKEPLQQFDFDDSNVEFKSKTGGGRGDRCLLCCLFFSLLILLVFLAGIVAFGLLYYRVFVGDELTVLEEKVSQLEMQLNQSQSAVNSIQAQLSSSQFMSQINSAVSGVQNVQQQLSSSRESISSTITGMLNQTRMNFTQNIADIDLVTINMQIAQLRATYFQGFQDLEDNLRFFSADAASQIVTRLTSDQDSSSNVTAQQGVNFTTGILSKLGDGIRSTYVRWGSDSCPNIIGTTLVYSGYVGGSSFLAQGGGHNQLCMPMDPETDALRTEPGIQGYSQIYGAEYAILQLDQNVPCAVCSVTIGAEVVMIPAKNSCPSDWTTEYDGYLMSEGPNNFRSSYICVDRSTGTVPGTSLHSLATDLFLCKADCDSLFCPPYSNTRVIGCVVCSK